jgi:arylsulfatase A-like enzyme
MPSVARWVWLAIVAGVNATFGAVPRPNLVFIMTDDHAVSALGCYGNRLVSTPHLDRLAADGMRFDRACVTNSLCAPSRSTVLTGTYSHINGVRGNSEATNAIERLDRSLPTFPQLLRDAGYTTAIVGKWHLADPPVGFDYACVLPGQGLYFDPEFIENGTRRKIPGYATDIATDLALDWLQRRDAARPFCLLLQHKAPHRPFLPPPRHADRHARQEIPFPSTFEDDYATRAVAAEAADMRIEESLAGDYPELPKNLSAAEKKRWIYQRFVKDYYGAIAGVDDSVGRVLGYLEENQLLGNTVVIYTSDNGFFVGDHGWYDKRYMYEPSLRVPLIIRAPGGARGQTDALTVNIDVAPTLLDYAGVSAPRVMQGRSLRALVEGRKPADWRSSIYYAYYENSWALLVGRGREVLTDPSFQYLTPHRVGPHRGVRTATHKLIEYYSDPIYWELFDLTRDPQELRNLYGTPGTERLTAELKAELSRLRKEFRDD